MMTLVVGGSGSGKSAYAEKLAVSYASSGKEYGHTNLSSENIKEYYLATMQVFDGEGRRKVERHRELRSGKGFLTIEQPTAIHKAISKMEAGEKTVLLECISNLTANEMFSGAEPQAETRVTAKIIKGIERLKEEVTHFVIVSNNVFEDGIVYDETTMAYIRAMGKINQKLAAMADKVVEVVVGIPVVIKQ